MTAAERYIESLPVSRFPDMLQPLSEMVKYSGRTIIVLDDDPTGCQTVYDVPVLFQWDEDLLVKLLNGEERLVFLLTNSRSMPEEQAVKLYEDIRDLLRKVCDKVGKEVSIVSRSDSTLRGHYPAEPYALHRFFSEAPIHVLIPAFFQGGRYTLDDEHYVKSGEEFIPAASTPFAQDKVFGFQHSNLKDYVEEKTGGKVRAEQVFSFDIESLRTRGPGYVAEKLQFAMPGAVAFVNAYDQNDLNIFALGALMAEGNGKSILYRTAASFLNSFAAISPKEPLMKEELQSGKESGGVFIVGSYVPKSSAQLESLIDQTDIFPIEVDVEQLITSGGKEIINSVVSEASSMISAGKSVVIYTSRKLVYVEDEEGNLRIGAQVSAALLEIGGALSDKASFIVAKGGITSHDIAAKGIGIKKATVIGQALPGVPVLIPEENKELKYIIFPGNVGEDDALVKLYSKLTQ